MHQFPFHRSIFVLRTTLINYFPFWKEEGSETVKYSAAVSLEWKKPQTL